MFKFGISTACLYPMGVLESVNEIGSLDIDICEIFMNSLSETEPFEIKKIKEALKKSNTQVVSLHPFTAVIEGLLFFSGYKKRISDGIELYKRFFEAAQQLGAKYFVFHGERDHTTYGQTMIDEQSAFEVYEKLCEAANNHGLLFTQENVAHFRSQSPSFLSNLKNALGEKIGFTFDIKQAYRGGSDPYALIEAMGERLVHFHINDFGKSTECCLLGNGDTDYKKIFASLEKINYKGDFVLEVYRKNFGDLKELKANLDDFNKKFPVKNHFVTEKIENNFVVLEDSNNSFINVDRALLPHNLKEGDCVTNCNGVFSINNELSDQRLQIIKNKLSKIFD